VTDGLQAERDVERIFASHYPYVRQTVLRLVHDPVEAQDLTQETFIRAFRALPRFRGESSVRTWLARIAQNVVLDHYRRAARQRGVDPRWAELVELDAFAEEDAMTPAQMTEQQQSGACVQRCVDSLSEDYRQAVVLHDMVGLTNVEIARLLGVTLATVKIRVHRGRRQLRSTFAEHCEVYTDDRNELACRPKAEGDDE
jgi:RNA polymerase sigma-70 factor (ECF subfamily)